MPLAVGAFPVLNFLFLSMAYSNTADSSHSRNNKIKKSLIIKPTETLHVRESMSSRRAIDIHTISDMMDAQHFIFTID